VSPFWDDLDPAGVGTVWKYYDQQHDRLIVQWNAFRQHGATAPYTFQVILYPNGTIEFVYQAMTGQLNSATVGIKGRGGTESLQLAYNQNYVQSNMLVRFYRPGDATAWCRLMNLQQGVIPQSSSVSVPFMLRNNLQPNEVRYGSFRIECSDPVTPALTAWVTLDNRPDTLPPQLIITTESAGIRLSWNRTRSPYWCVYSSALDDTLLLNYEGASADTFFLMPYPPDRIRYYQIRPCGGPLDSGFGDRGNRQPVQQTDSHIEIAGSGLAPDPNQAKRIKP
jgi:hypothetical protein